MKKLTLLFAAFIILFGESVSQNAAQWRGQDRNGNYYEKNLLKKWPESGPDSLWSVNGIGEGYSSASVTEDMVYITGMKDSLEYISAIDLNGKLKWQTQFGIGWTLSFPGSRATPTVEGNKVYIISGSGEVVCLDAGTGKIIWKLDAYKEFEGNRTLWGVCESPLIIGDKLIYTPGGAKTTMVALDKKSGKTIWHSKSIKDSTAYVSPLLIDHNGTKIISTILSKNFIGVNPENGKILWKYDYTQLKWNQTHYRSPVINCNTPYYYAGQMYITKGYDHKSAMFSLSEKGDKINLMWTDTVLDVHVGHVVYKDGYLYGANWINNRNGNWCCLDWKTGEVKYEKKWENKGSIIMADNLLYCYDEKGGNLALVEPTPDDFKIISSFKIEKGKGPHWAHPVIRNGVLYARHGDYLMAYNIKKK
ncbi:MAG: PQQ-binding-like beta-propeller repeat protein [bacterium]|nr:PQQ-binding-like beta-propeller repeat protein [bacterium]